MPHADTDANFFQMNAPRTNNAQGRAASDRRAVKAQPNPALPATLGQKVFIVGLYLYVLSLVWLTLSHYWYGVLPNWLDPH